MKLTNYVGIQIILKVSFADSPEDVTFCQKYPSTSTWFAPKQAKTFYVAIFADEVNSGNITKLKIH